MFKAILLSLILCLPVQAETIEAQATQSQFQVKLNQTLLNGHVEESQSPTLTEEAAQPAPLSPLSTNVTRFDLSAKHGDHGVGVIGAFVFNTGVIRTVYPCSDLNNYGVQSGDRILQADGMRWSQFLLVINTFEKVYDPGQKINLYVARDGHTIKIPLKLIDARQLANYATDNHINACLQHTQSW